MDTNPLQRIDHSALRTNQAVIIILGIAAYILNLPTLAAGIALVMGIGTVLGIPGFIWVYRYFARPLKIMRPDILEDHNEPHRFAQGLGAAFFGLGAVALFAGYGAVGWGLAWLVVALAALNLFAGFCVGCAVYYWLSRLNVAGFTQSPPPGIFPGRRPTRNGGAHG